VRRLASRSDTPRPGLLLRALSTVLVVLLLVAAVSVASHGHLSNSHEQTCAACMFAEARSLAATPYEAPPVPVCELHLMQPLTRDTVPHSRPPLESAPKHGPPARFV